MNVLGKMHDIRFPTIYIMWNIIYYILPLTIVAVLAIKAVDSSKVRQGISNIFAMHYGDINYQTWFLFLFLIFQTNYYDFSMVEEIKKRKLNWFHVLNILKKFPHLKSLSFEPRKNCTVCSAFNSPWKIETFWWTTSPSWKGFKAHK